MPESKSSLRQLRAQLKNCMRADYFRFSRQIHQLEKKPDDARENILVDKIDASCQRKIKREGSLPELSWPPELPVCESREEIHEAIKKHQIVLVCGETGSGKTTQLPKICLQAGRGINGTIGHTQPRRLAARAVATRLAEELRSPLGHLVGYQTRFQQQLSENNLVKIMTDGILLAEIQQDRWLNRYDTIIIDEAHERSLNIDFLLGYLKRLLKKRRDLKLIITSATIDADRIARHFDNAPIIEVSGKTYPVEIRYSSPLDEEDEAGNLPSQIDSAIDELQAEGRGDVLVFLPGEREIHETYRALRHRRDRFDLLPLYARLPASEQQKIFHPGGRARIILTTNVAETSLTVPGIRYVVDTGLARISRYSWRTKVQRLPTEKISQASANQRAGRCGRTAPGICIRLYTEEDFVQRTEFTDPEIMRTNLASVILQMSAQKLGDIEQFPFIDKPDPRLIRDGFRLLHELQAMDEKRQLLQLGRTLARLPIDPRFGRMLLAANLLGCVAEVLTIVSALTIRDPRERPHDKQQAADEKHERFNDVRSDFITIVNLWQYLEEQNETLSQSRMRKLCQKEFFSYRRWREWRDLHRQIKLALQDQGIKLNQQPADYDQIHQALLSGLLDHVGFREEKQQYLGARNRKMYIFPGSGIGSKLPKWLVAAEISETTKLYARTVASIQPQWVERIGAHLLRHHYSEPHWQKRAAKVGGFEKLTLYGLIINPRRSINYANVDAVVSREIFIRHALIYGEWNTRISVVRDNLQRMSVIEDLEVRLRRRDLLADEEVIFDFYDRVLPAHIHSGAAFEKWYRKLDNPDLLYLSEEKLLQEDEPAPKIDNEFPKSWKQGNLRLTLSYKFEPGAGDDGVTLHIPLAALRQVDAARCQWLVPGLLEEKVLALIKALPKRLRKHFVPAPDFARVAMENLQPYQGSLIETLTQVLGKITGTYVPEEEWNQDIPSHLRMRFVVTGAKKQELGNGRDLNKLQSELADTAKKQKPVKIKRHLERQGITDWNFGELPDFVDCKEEGYEIRRFSCAGRKGW